MVSRKAETEVKERLTGGKTDRQRGRQRGIGRKGVCVGVRERGRKSESECVCEKERESYHVLLN